MKNNHPDKLANPSHSDFTPQEIVDICCEQLKLAQQLQARSDGQIQICTSLEQIQACQQNKQLGIVLHLEGAEFLAIQPDLLDVFYEAGLRSIGPLKQKDGPQKRLRHRSKSSTTAAALLGDMRMST